MLCLSELKRNIEDTYAECIKYPFMAYDRGEFDYFYHLLNKANEVVNANSQEYYYDIDFDEFVRWYEDFEKPFFNNHN